ncbi:fumarylacetoacetate hydrolase family protein [Microtetraspora sp. AC03309]|uniref:2-keto-4-pentenoate hydratase n=1 Tax=Microtetraspora sp. AC03309 TaxID=2779376 RepID=UPI001E4F0ED0|nr:fumarylacetoacetate hydrolase family protein [Microtetraspora sp. AC03309]MCC5578115.1 fumarylacetoacetate hydrolase family protein [Microtetraspora sp. AC03309]
MNDERSDAVPVHGQAADRLLSAAASGRPCAPVRDLISTAADGYAVQEINTRRALADGRRLVGRKIGITNPAVQRQFGIDQPDFGVLFADMWHPDGLPIPYGRFLQPRAEAEIALVIDADLRGGPFTVADVMRAVEFVLPAIEIVDSRIADWDITLADTIADNASSGGFVLGNTPVALTGLDLKTATMSMTRNGQEVSTGSGAACLGHPLNAAVWLADTLGRTDFPLRAGDIVLTGALGPVVPVERADVFEARVEGVGSVTAVFGS